MKYLVLVGIAMALLILGIQDFRERKISVLLLITIFTLCILFVGMYDSIATLPQRILINATFIILILVSGTLMVRLKRKKEALSTFIGSGDFLFPIAISPMFSLEAFLVFLNTSILCILLVYGILLARKKITARESIPFAGALAFSLIGVLIANEFIKTDLISFTLNSFLQ